VHVEGTARRTKFHTGHSTGREFEHTPQEVALTFGSCYPLLHPRALAHSMLYRFPHNREYISSIYTLSCCHLAESTYFGHPGRSCCVPASLCRFASCSSSFLCCFCFFCCRLSSSACRARS